MSRLRALLRAALAGVVVALGAATAAGAEVPSEALRRGLREEAPEARIAAVEQVGRVIGPAPKEERRKTALLLRKALETDGAPLVRVACVRALARCADEVAWVPVLAAALDARDEGVRAAAVDAVLLAPGDVVAPATRLLREDEDPTFRAETALLLGRRRKPDAVPALLAALRDPHPRVATAAAEALEAVSGEAHGWDPVAWEAWWVRARATPAVPSTGETVTRESAPPTTPPPPPPPARGLVPDLFGLSLRGDDYVFVVDVSGSIGAEGLESAKSTLVKAVERLPSHVRFAALFFDETVKSFHPETTRATPAAKAELARFVRGIPRGKRTDVMTPLNAGLAILRRRVEARAKEGVASTEPVTMVVLSDGQENQRATPGEVVGEKLDRLDLAQAVVHAIVLGGRDNALMAALARRGRGAYRVVP